MTGPSSHQVTPHHGINGPPDGVAVGQASAPAGLKNAGYTERLGIVLEWHPVGSGGWQSCPPGCNIRRGFARHLSVSGIRDRLRGGIFCAESKDHHFSQIEVALVCRNIKTLFNFEPPVTDDEIRAASLQFVRKVSGFNTPSKGNEAAFLAAVDQVAAVSRHLLSSLETNAPPKDRAEEAAKARARAAYRFSR